MSLRDVVYEDVTLAHVRRERHHGKAVMNAVMTLQIVQEMGILLTNYLRHCHRLKRMLSLGVIN